MDFGRSHFRKDETSDQLKTFLPEVTSYKINTLVPEPIRKVEKHLNVHTHSV
jgi:hypothetical protein